MKKLMFIAAAAAMTSAFGVQVADYGAQVAYADLQTVSGVVNGKQVKITFKFVKNCTIKGYLLYSDCACDSALNDGRVNPALLAVTSTAQTPAVKGGKKTPRIFPAELLVRTWDRSLGGSDTIEAEGYLFAGFGKGAYVFDEGDDGRGYGVRPWANYSAIYADDSAGTYWWDERDTYTFGSARTFATYKLFGDANSAFSGSSEFYDAWLDHAGFGKASYAAGTSAMCGISTPGGRCLKTLQGYLIGGLYLCGVNAYDFAGAWDWFPCHRWYGTTDVVTGLWAMRKFVNECPAQALAAADGSFYTGIHAVTAEDGSMTGDLVRRGVPGEGKYLVNQQKAGYLFENLKAICAQGFGIANLGFVDNEDSSLRTALLLQDGSRDIWYDVNTTKTTDADYDLGTGEGVWAGENTPWEHFFTCTCSAEAL